MVGVGFINKEDWGMEVLEKQKVNCPYVRRKDGRLGTEIMINGQRHFRSSKDESKLNEKLKQLYMGNNDDIPKFENVLSNDTIVYQVYESYEYEKFIRLIGNRILSRVQINKIKQSIMTNGWLYDPILCNEKFEIIDGQHRYEALKELGMPIQYIIVKGIAAKECQALNAAQKNWTSKDFIYFYAENKIESYIYLKDLMERFPKISVNTINYALLNIGNVSSAQLKSGVYECTKEQYLEAIKALGYLNTLVEYTAKVYGRVDYLNTALIFIYKHEPKCDLERLKTKIVKYHAQIDPPADIRSALKTLENLYNKQCRSDLMNFQNDYIQYARENGRGTKHGAKENK